ncbi:MAG: hypothetical protein JXB10_05835 [Pirellulales bacterium]|nr:hypothetical protein [Pirellulales bacterium]
MEARSRPWQFSLGALMAVITAAAVACSLFISMPNVYATPALIFISVGLPAVLTTVAVYGRGYKRTFCLGALFPAGTMLVCTGFMTFVHVVSAYQNNVRSVMEFIDKVGPYYRPFVGFAWGACLIIGLLCMIVRRLAEGRAEG